MVLTGVLTSVTSLLGREILEKVHCATKSVHTQGYPNCGTPTGGKRTLQLLRTPGHSIDGISVMVEDCRVLVAGDCAATGIVPALGDGDGRTLEASLRWPADMDVEVLVPGHGPVLRGAAVGDWLNWGADYLRQVRQRVRQRLLDGVPVDELADTVPYDEELTRLPR